MPVESVPRSAEVRDVRYVLPEIVNCVVDAPPLRKVVPVNVEEACEMMPLPNVWRAFQFRASVVFGMVVEAVIQ